MSLAKQWIRGDSRIKDGAIRSFCEGKIGISPDDIGQPTWYSVGTNQETKSLTQEITTD